MSQHRIIHGDLFDKLPEIEAGSIDAGVTDPPYGIGFMGKKWDSFKPDNIMTAAQTKQRKDPEQIAHLQNVYGRKRSPAQSPSGISYDESLSGHRSFQSWTEGWAREVYRVLKPGGHLLVCGAPRSYHRMASGLEDAGFEIRDCIMWVFGSGFPKSLDVSKAIDSSGERFEFFSELRIYLKNALVKSGLSVKQVNERMGFATNGSGMAGHWFGNETQQTLPTKEQWFQLKTVLGFDECFDTVFAAIVSPHERPVIGKLAAPAKSIYSQGKVGLSKDVNITAPATDSAKRWQGWGTALKPAWEPIIVARKPLVGTVAANVMQHGTGAMNIDGCRVPVDVVADASQIRAMERGQRTDDTSGQVWGLSKNGGDVPQVVRPEGRWPANLILSYPENEYELRDDVTPEQLRQLAGWMDAH